MPPGRGCGTRLLRPERVCGTWGALRMPFSHLRGGLKPPHCSGGFIPPARFSSAGAACASRSGSRDAIRASRSGLRDGPAVPGSRTNHRELQRSPGTGLPTSRTVCPDNAPPTSNLPPPTSRTDLPPPTSRTKSFRCHSYEKCARKPFGIHSYAIVGLKVPWNEYLQKKGRGGVRAFRANHDTTSLCH